MRSTKMPVLIESEFSRRILCHPKQGLADGEITDDFRNRGVRIEVAPNGEIFGAVKRDACEEKARLANGPVVPVFDIVFIEPRVLVSDEGEHKGHRFGETAAFGRFECKEIVTGRPENLADGGHRVEIEDAVAVRLGAREFERQTAVRSDLIRDDHFFEAPAAEPGGFGVFRVSGEFSGLRKPAGGVIVLRVALGDPIFRCCHPVEIIREPFLEAGGFGGGERICPLDDGNRPNHFDKMKRVDNSPIAAGIQIAHGLRVLQIGIHPRGRIEKPRAEMQRGMAGVFDFVRQLPRCGKRWHLNAQADQREAMVIEITGVRNPVALFIRTIEIVRVGPEIVAFGKIVVLAPGATGAGCGSYRDGLLVKVTIRSREDAAAIDGRDVGSLRIRTARRGERGNAGKGGCFAEFAA
jgi:hypothetical protein